MSGESIAVTSHPPERREQRSQVLYCCGCCCCCCCLHTLGAAIGAGLGTLPAAAVAPRRVSSALSWFWGAVAVVLGVVSVGSVVAYESLAAPLLVVLIGFPLILLAAGLIALLGVALQNAPERGRAVLAVAALTGTSLLGALAGLGLMLGVAGMLR